MRLVQVSVPTGTQTAVQELLEGEGLPYVVSDETSDRDIEAVISFPTRQDRVEAILEELYDIGIDTDDYIVISEAPTIVSEGFPGLAEPEETEEYDDRIAREELLSRANELLPGRETYFVMTAVSAIVATAGVLMDSAAVVVGSMVIAPLIGPSLAASIGTVLEEPDLSRIGVRWQILGIILAVVSATVFAFLVRWLFLVPPGTDILGIDQVRERVAPDFLALIIALGAGIAGALSLSTGVSAALVGVMIAVALIPPAAVMGIGIAWGMPEVVIGSAILLTVNVLVINLAALGVLWYMGFRPTSWFEVEKVRSRLIRRGALLVASIVVISLFLGGATIASYQMSTQEDAVQSEIETVLEDPAYEELVLLEMEITRDNRPILPRTTGVTVTLGRPAGTPPPMVVHRLEAAISDRFDRPVTVEVRHVEREVT